jgi:hypothetical protein
MWDDNFLKIVNFAYIDDTALHNEVYKKHQITNRPRHLRKIISRCWRVHSKHFLNYYMNRGQFLRNSYNQSYLNTF